MPHNALSNISLSSSLYSIYQVAPQALVNLPANQSFTSKINTAAHSTQAFASARAYSGYSSYTSQQAIIANPVDPGFSVASKGTHEAQKPLSPQDLVNNRFILQSVNGTPFVAKNKEKIPELSFDENLQMSGVMGNYFSGKATLSGDQLKTEGLAMTRMLSHNPQLNELDVQFDKMLNKGAKISFDGYELTLKNNEYTLIWMQAAPQYFSY
ncbi:META domain-containing protein [Klebsiella sp. BIGb0407]|uniref:META domain-containing protein n=1 Tax=Klebsiella sp. BIGb0407 TaxID=2940603 RepID=UPI0021684D9B|nr:META domain-containing protein [Klebsiella sp. BIGb0407]MCS3430652.1 heat shock protein HslJ [Klebsiella sp. BIGb0407]